jgi:glycosyltransferase involved in cell wall biosynthesis
MSGDVAVSVIVPSFNYGRYLAQRIDSILSQTYHSREIIVIDDASTDNSVDVISRYSNAGDVRAVLCASNSGTVYQRWNEAAALARGRYLWFAGADDYCDSNFLAEMVTQLELNPGAVVAFSRSWMVHADGRRIHAAPAWTRTGITGGKSAQQALVLDTTIPTASAVVFQSSAFREAGGFNLDFPHAADWKLYIDMLSGGDLCYVAKPLNYCRVHPQTVSIKSRRSGTEALERYAVLQTVWSEHPQLLGLRDKAMNLEAERNAFAVLNSLRCGDVASATRIARVGMRFDDAFMSRLPGTASGVMRRALNGVKRRWRERERSDLTARLATYD